MDAPPAYELYAIRYAEHTERRASDNFIDGDAGGAVMPLDYFVWAIRGNGRTIVIDTGFDAAAAAERNRTLLRSPLEGLAALRIAPGDVEDVIITHLHYDHAGNAGAFPHAKIHVQDREMQYATGRYMTHARLRGPFDPHHIATLVHAVFGERVVFHDGDWELAPGITAHLIGGHTAGLQVVRVNTTRGRVVLASDASHLYANIEQNRPFPIVHDVGAMIEGYARIRALADSPQHIIPGHDPAVMTRYAAPTRELQGIAVRLDVEPAAAPL